MEPMDLSLRMAKSPYAKYFILAAFVVAIFTLNVHTVIYAGED
jgi:hypothetical protein